MRQQTQQDANKHKEEEVCYQLNMDVNHAGFTVFKTFTLQSFLRKEMHPACLVDLKDTHNVIWWVTLNVNITFVCLREQIHRTPLNLCVFLFWVALLSSSSQEWGWMDGLFRQIWLVTLIDLSCVNLYYVSSDSVITYSIFQCSWFRHIFLFQLPEDSTCPSTSTSASTPLIHIWRVYQSVSAIIVMLLRLAADGEKQACENGNRWV